MRSRLLAGLFDTPVGLAHEQAVAEQRADAILERFVGHGRPRLVIGHFRYGKKVEQGAKFDAVGSAIQRLQRYLRDGNQEDLVDAANLCAVELTECWCHDNPHFSSTDDGEHTKETT